MVYITLTAFDNVHRGDRVFIYHSGFNALNPSTGKVVTIRKGAVKCKVIEVTKEYSVVEVKDQTKFIGGELVLQ